MCQGRSQKLRLQKWLQWEHTNQPAVPRGAGQNRPSAAAWVPPVPGSSVAPEGSWGPRTKHASWGGRPSRQPWEKLSTKLVIPVLCQHTDHPTPSWQSYNSPYPLSKQEGKKGTNLLQKPLLLKQPCDFHRVEVRGCVFFSLLYHQVNYWVYLGAPANRDPERDRGWKVRDPNKASSHKKELTPSGVTLSAIIKCSYVLTEVLPFSGLSDQASNLNVHQWMSR